MAEDSVVKPVAIKFSACSHRPAQNLILSTKSNSLKYILNKYHQEREDVMVKIYGSTSIDGKELFEMENKLMPFQDPAIKPPSMSEKEFKEAIDNILPLTNDKLRRQLFCEAEKLVKKEGQTGRVPIIRLAQVASYLGLLNITTVVRDTVNTRIQEWRGRPSSSGSARVLADHDSQLLAPQDTPLITMSRVKQLSTNISRRLKLRQERYEMADVGSDW